MQNEAARQLKWWEENYERIRRTILNIIQILLKRGKKATQEKIEDLTNEPGTRPDDHTESTELTEEERSETMQLLHERGEDENFSAFGVSLVDKDGVIIDPKHPDYNQLQRDIRAVDKTILYPDELKLKLKESNTRLEELYGEFVNHNSKETVNTITNKLKSGEIDNRLVMDNPDYQLIKDVGLTDYFKELMQNDFLQNEIEVLRSTSDLAFNLRMECSDEKKEVAQEHELIEKIVDEVKGKLAYVDELEGKTMSPYAIKNEIAVLKEEKLKDTNDLEELMNSFSVFTQYYDKDLSVVQKQILFESRLNDLQSKLDDPYNRLDKEKLRKDIEENKSKLEKCKILSKKISEADIKISLLRDLKYRGIDQETLTSYKNDFLKQNPIYKSVTGNPVIREYLKNNNLNNETIRDLFLQTRKHIADYLSFQGEGVLLQKENDAWNKHFKAKSELFSKYNIGVSTDRLTADSTVTESYISSTRDALTGELKAGINGQLLNKATHTVPEWVQVSSKNLNQVFQMIRYSKNSRAILNHQNRMSVVVDRYNGKNFVDYNFEDSAKTQDLSLDSCLETQVLWKQRFKDRIKENPELYNDSTFITVEMDRDDVSAIANIADQNNDMFYVTETGKTIDNEVASNNSQTVLLTTTQKTLTQYKEKFVKKVGDRDASPKIYSATIKGANLFMANDINKLVDDYSDTVEGKLKDGYTLDSVVTLAGIIEKSKDYSTKDTNIILTDNHFMEHTKSDSNSMVELDDVVNMIEDYHYASSMYSKSLDDIANAKVNNPEELVRKVRTLHKENDDKVINEVPLQKVNDTYEIHHDRDLRCLLYSRKKKRILRDEHDQVIEVRVHDGRLDTGNYLDNETGEVDVIPVEEIEEERVNRKYDEINPGIALLENDDYAYEDKVAWSYKIDLGGEEKVVEGLEKGIEEREV